ncbi:MAG: hypothetical protein HRT47_10135 [Candidatus Caenarcaniphilales bacterium]|nr:hypothetical protein [Candidatus Caenarcaniphilales bacterium]
MKIKSLLVALFSFLFIHAAQAVNIEFDTNREVILVNNVVFGTPFVITDRDLSAAIAAKTDGKFDGEGEFEVRLFFSPASEEQLAIINNENVLSSSQSISLRGITNELSGKVSSVRYARTQSADKTRGLSRGSVTTTEAGIYTTYSTRPKILPFISGNNQNLFVFSLLAANVPSRLALVVNVESNTLTTDANPALADSSESDDDDEDDEDEDPTDVPPPSLDLSTFEGDLTSIGANEANAYNGLQVFKIKCGAIGNDGTDVCTEAGMKELEAVVESARVSLVNSLKAVRSLAKQVRAAFKDKIITGKQGKDIFKELNCVVKLDKVADQRLGKIDKLIDKLNRKQKVLNDKQFLRVDTLKSSAQDRIFTAYDECKKRLASKLRAVSLISQETADQFNADISAFGIGENG